MANRLVIFSTLLVISMATAMPYTGSDYNQGGYNQASNNGYSPGYGTGHYGYGAGYGGGMRNLGTTNKGYGYGGVSNSYGGPVGGGYGLGSRNIYEEDQDKDHKDLETESVNTNTNTDHLSKVTDTKTADVTGSDTIIGTDHTLNLDVLNKQVETNDQVNIFDNTVGVGNDEHKVPESSISNSEPLLITGTVNHVPGIPETHLSGNINSNHEEDQKLVVNDFGHKDNTDVGVTNNIVHDFGVGTSNFQTPLYQLESADHLGNAGQLYTVTEAADIEDTADTANTVVNQNTEHNIGNQHVVPETSVNNLDTADTANTVDNQNTELNVGNQQVVPEAGINNLQTLDADKTLDKQHTEHNVGNQYEVPETGFNNLDIMGAANTLDHSLDKSAHTFTADINKNHEAEHNIVNTGFEDTNIIQEVKNKDEKNQFEVNANADSSAVGHLPEGKVVDSTHSDEWNDNKFIPRPNLSPPQGGSYGYGHNTPLTGSYGQGFNSVPQPGSYGHGFNNPHTYPNNMYNVHYPQFSHRPGHFNPHGQYQNSPPPYYPEYYPPPMHYHPPMYQHNHQSQRQYEHDHNHGHVHSAGCGHTGY